ncbi:MAG: ArgE/DapE family deacylase [Acidobacteria bacterium]|nr:MAG: ArgE/DapE family deacylase [Acidobacteriota bacterium]
MSAKKGEHRSMSSVEQNIKDKVFSIVDDLEEKLADLCSELVRISSINPNYPGVNRNEVVGGEAACNEHLAQEYRRLGCKVDLWEEEPGRANVVGVLAGSGGGRSLIFNGHIDTVPVGNHADWKFQDPFSGVIDNGRLYGRGACDMKAGIAAQYIAAFAIKECGLKLRGDIILESVVGEETMDHELGTSACIRRGYRADAACVSEPTAPPLPLAVVPVTPGLLWMTLNCTGRATHSSVRDELIRAGGLGSRVGVNAIEKGMIILQSLQKLEEHWGQSKSHLLFKPGHFTIHPGVIRGGPHGVLIPFVISEFCEIEYAIWYPPQESEETIKQEIEEWIHRTAQLDPWLEKHPPTIEWKLNWPAAEISTEHPVAQCCHQAARAAGVQVEGDGSLFRGFAAVCDAAFLDAAGIPTVVCGPGSLLVAHAINEYVTLEDVVKSAKVYAWMALSWCGYDRN